MTSRADHESDAFPQNTTSGHDGDESSASDERRFLVTLEAEVLSLFSEGRTVPERERVTVSGARALATLGHLDRDSRRHALAEQHYLDALTLIDGLEGADVDAMREEIETALGSLPDE